VKRPHPYNSRQNQVVRNALLERLREIAKGQSFIHIEDDVHTNAAFLDGPDAVYFQGTNILVKVDGTDNVTESKRVLHNKVSSCQIYEQMMPCYSRPISTLSQQLQGLLMTA